MDEEESNNRPNDEDGTEKEKDKSGSTILLSPRPPIIIGAVPGVPVGTIFGNRKHLRHAGIHRPPMAGICGNPQRGAESIVLNSGYEDDVDEGDTIVYTGAGSNQGGKQVADQELTGTNAALVKSEEMDLPVRVVRGSKLQSEYASPYGFRYDGLYRVVEHYKTVGTSGFAVWQFKMTRLPDQAELPGRLSDKERAVLAKKLKKQFEPILQKLRDAPQASEVGVKSERKVKSEKKVKRERDELDDLSGVEHELLPSRKRRRTSTGDATRDVKQERRPRGPAEPLAYQHRGYPGLKLATLPTWKLVSIILRGYCPLCVKLLFNCDVPVLHINENNYLELASALDHARLNKAINHLIEHQMYIRDLTLRGDRKTDPLEHFAAQHLMNQVRVRSFVETLEDETKDYSHILEGMSQLQVANGSPHKRNVYSNVEEVTEPIEDVQYLFANDMNVTFHDYLAEMDDGPIEVPALNNASLANHVKPNFTTEVVTVIDDESDNNNNIVIVDGYTLFVSNKWDYMTTSNTTSTNKTPVQNNNTNVDTPTDSNKKINSGNGTAIGLSLYDAIVVDDEDEFAFQNKMLDESSTSEEEEDDITRPHTIYKHSTNNTNVMKPASVPQKENGFSLKTTPITKANGVLGPNNNNNTVNKAIKPLFQLDEGVIVDDDE